MERDPEELRDFETDVPWEALGARPILAETPVGRLALLLRPSDGAAIAVDAWCPHLDGPLWEGGVSGDEIACPWHGWRYSLVDGACTWAPRGDAEEAAETEVTVRPLVRGPGGRAALRI